MHIYLHFQMDAPSTHVQNGSHFLFLKTSFFSVISFTDPNQKLQVILEFSSPLLTLPCYFHNTEPHFSPGTLQSSLCLFWCFQLVSIPSSIQFTSYILLRHSVPEDKVPIPQNWQKRHFITWFFSYLTSPTSSLLHFHLSMMTAF